ncbi:MAG: SMP-30/gluconolactonase/LRE family protein [Gemmataceae bacterium]
MRRLLALTLLISSIAPAWAQMPTRKIEKMDSALDALIDPDAKIEVLAGDFKWAEGPAWDKKNKAVLFTDIPNNRIMKWSETGGILEYIKPSGYTGTAKFEGYEPGANGLAFNSKGVLTMCQHGDRCVAQWANGKFTRIATHYEGKRFNSPNDLVFHPNGDLYFTDPPYGLPKNMDDPAKELPFQGVYRLGKDGKITLLTKEMSRPNGIAFSPDAKTLYVANSDNDAAAIWKSFPVKADGTLGEGKLFFDSMEYVKKKWPGSPDGMKVDTQGNVWATGPGGVWIFNSAGKPLGLISTGVPTANVAFGDDGKTLYITANHELLRVKVKVKGLGF